MQGHKEHDGTTKNTKGCACLMVGAFFLPLLLMVLFALLTQCRVTTAVGGASKEHERIHEEHEGLCLCGWFIGWFIAFYPLLAPSLFGATRSRQVKYSLCPLWVRRVLRDPAFATRAKRVTLRRVVHLWMFHRSPLSAQVLNGDKRSRPGLPLCSLWFLRVLRDPAFEPRAKRVTRE